MRLSVQVRLSLFNVKKGVKMGYYNKIHVSFGVEAETLEEARELYEEILSNVLVTRDFKPDDSSDLSDPYSVFYDYRSEYFNKKFLELFKPASEPSSMDDSFDYFVDSLLEDQDYFKSTHPSSQGDETNPLIYLFDFFSSKDLLDCKFDVISETSDSRISAHSTVSNIFFFGYGGFAFEFESQDNYKKALKTWTSVNHPDIKKITEILEFLCPNFLAKKGLSKSITSHTM